MSSMNNNVDFLEDTKEELKRLRDKQLIYNRRNDVDEKKKSSLRRSLSLPRTSSVKTVAQVPAAFRRYCRVPTPHPNPIPSFATSISDKDDIKSYCAPESNVRYLTLNENTGDNKRGFSDSDKPTFFNDGKPNDGILQKHAFENYNFADKTSNIDDIKSKHQPTVSSVRKQLFHVETNDDNVKFQRQNFTDKTNLAIDNVDSNNYQREILPAISYDEETNNRIPQYQNSINNTTNFTYENATKYQSLNTANKRSFSADERNNINKNDETKTSTTFAIIKAEPVHHQESRIMHQIDSYVTWINAQLEKRPRSRYVKDLSQDMKDGVAFLQLVEAISNTTQDIINSQAPTISDMQRNVNSVLQFLSLNNVRVHHILPKEIVEGNVKATMRLVLALAAHFKPDSFQGFHSTPKYNKTSRMQRAPSVVSLVSDAASSLAEASKNASKGGRMAWQRKYSRVQKFEEKPPTPNSAPAAQRPRSLRLESHDSVTSQLSCESTSSARYSVTNFPCTTDETRVRNRSVYTTPNKHTSGVKRALIPSAVEDQFSDADISQIVGMQDSLMEDLGETKEVLAHLQNLLTSGCTPEEYSGINSPKDETFQEQLVLKNIMLENKDSECSDLRKQLNELKEINLRLNNDKTSFELRLSQQEQLILSLKSKLIGLEHPKKPCMNKDELNTLLVERGKELQLLHEELTKRDEIIENQKIEIESLSNDVVNKKRMEANLYAKLEASESLVSNLQIQLREVADNMHSLSINTSNNSGNHDISGNHGNSGKHSSDSTCSNNCTDSTSNKLQQARLMKHKQKIAREHNNMMVTLANIQQRFPSDDPIQHAFQSMQQSMTTLINTITLLEQLNTEKTSSSNNGGNSNIPKGNEKPTIPPKPTRKKKSASTTVSSDSGYDHIANVSLEWAPVDPVKIVYFLGKSVTPILKNTDIGLGYLTLRDFKEVVKRPGKYRYFFKSKDRDFGFVREELLFDDDIVPGHDNKVVCWMERNMAEEV